MAVFVSKDLQASFPVRVGAITSLKRQLMCRLESPLFGASVVACT